jgi:hypothetical protein
LLCDRIAIDPSAPTTEKAKAKVKNAGWQPFAMLRINLRYDGDNNGDGECERPCYLFAEFAAAWTFFWSARRVGFPG